MSRGQRLAFLGIAVVIAVVAIVVLADRGNDDPSPPVRTSETPTATEDSPDPTATPTPTPTAAPPPLLTSGKVTRLDATEGDTVRFRVRSDAPDEAHIHGYDITKELEAGKTTTVSFKATITGGFEIELHHSGEQIGELRVHPK